LTSSSEWEKMGWPERSFLGFRGSFDLSVLSVLESDHSDTMYQKMGVIKGEMRVESDS
jgi:hypothetical protein